MQVLIDIFDPLPPGLNESYRPFGYWNFGVCCFQYVNPVFGGAQLYDGPIHFINSKHTWVEPEYPNPVNFRIYLKTGVQARVTPAISPGRKAPDIQFNGIRVNPTTGKGMLLLGSVQ